MKFKVNNLVGFWKCPVRIITLHTAHVTVEANAGMIIGIAAAEKLINPMIPTIFNQYGKGLFSEAVTLISIQNVQIIQADLKIFILTIVIRPVRKITHAPVSIPEKIIVLIRLFHSPAVRVCIKTEVVTVNGFVRINTTVGLIPYDLTSGGDNGSIRCRCL